MKLKDKEVQDMFKKLGDCDVIAFNPKEIMEKIEFAYQKRDSAHELLLQADVLLDEVLRELSGIKNNDKQATKGRKTNKRSGRASK